MKFINYLNEEKEIKIPKYRYDKLYIALQYIAIETFKDRRVKKTLSDV